MFFNHLFNCIETNNIQYVNQFGIRKNHSTTHGVIPLVEKVPTAFDTGKIVVGAYLDTIAHQISNGNRAPIARGRRGRHNLHRVCQTAVTAPSRVDCVVWTKHSHFPYTSICSSPPHNRNIKHKIHHIHYTNTQHTSTLQGQKKLFLTTAATQQTFLQTPTQSLQQT